MGGRDTGRRTAYTHTHTQRETAGELDRDTAEQPRHAAGTPAHTHTHSQRQKRTNEHKPKKVKTKNKIAPTLPPTSGGAAVGDVHQRAAVAENARAGGTGPARNGSQNKRWSHPEEPGAKQTAEDTPSTHNQRHWNIYIHTAAGCSNIRGAGASRCSRACGQWPHTTGLHTDGARAPPRPQHAAPADATAALSSSSSDTCTHTGPPGLRASSGVGALEVVVVVFLGALEEVVVVVVVVLVVFFFGSPPAALKTAASYCPSSWAVAHTHAQQRAKKSTQRTRRSIIVTWAFVDFACCSRCKLSCRAGTGQAQREHAAWEGETRAGAQHTHKRTETDSGGV
ncbi:hypothetical protein ECC02_013771, partial [Trypanosoma cruzi]